MILYENEPCMEGPRHLTLQSKMEDMNMTNPITIREACTQKDTEFFWAQLHAYQARDLFPDPESEARAFFLSERPLPFRNRLYRKIVNIILYSISRFLKLSVCIFHTFYTLSIAFPLSIRYTEL